MGHNALIISAILILTIAGATFFYLDGNSLNLAFPNKLPTIEVTPTPNPTPTFQGQVTSVVPDLNVIIIKLSSNKDLTLAITPQTKLFDENNQPASLSYFQKGFTIKGSGVISPDQHFTPTEIHITKAPNVILFIPLANSQVGRDFEVTGTARGSNNTPFVRITNLRTGDVYINSPSVINAAAAGVYADFYYQVKLSSDTNIQSGDPLLIEAFDKSPSDGSAIDKVSVNVTFKDE